MIRETTVGEAWDDVMEQMPEGWVMHSLLNVHEGTKRAQRRGPHWRAHAARRRDLGLAGGGMTATGSSPEGALLRLADLLTSVGKSRRA